MKRILYTWVVTLALGIAFPQAVSAQSVLDGIVNGLRGSAGSGTLSAAVSSLVGTKAVSKASLVGTWSYTGPAIAFKSSNLANQLGGVLAAASAEKKLAAALEKYGLRSGKVKLTFKSDDTYSCVMDGRTVSGKYSVSGATLTLTKSGVQAIKANVCLVGKELQLSVEVDKLLSLASAMGTAAGANASISSLTSLMEGFDGVYLGVKFSK